LQPFAEAVIKIVDFNSEIGYFWCS